MTGISNLQKMFGQVTVSLPHSAGPYAGGWSDVLQTDSSGTCKRAALQSAAALLGIAKVKLESAEMPLALCNGAKRN